MQQYFNYNGKFLPVGTPILSPASRAFRFGDSLFETIRIESSEPVRWTLHMDRLLAGMKMLGFEVPPFFDSEVLCSVIKKLAVKNRVTSSGRVRLTIFRKEGGLYDPISNLPEWVVECAPLPVHYQTLNDNGYILDIAAGNTKGLGPLSNLKTGNYLLYVLAAQAAREYKVNECAVLNSFGRLADTSIFNIFIAKNGRLSTPSLDEAPVAGTMRRHIIEQCRQTSYQVLEVPIAIEDLEGADEVFLTNALYGIRWVKSFRSSRYAHRLSAQLYSTLFPTK